MKIGLFTYRQTPFISANTSIGYAIAKELIKENEVYLIGYRQSDSQYSIKEYKGIPIEFLNSKIENRNIRLQSLKRRLFGDKYFFRNLSKSLNQIIEKDKIERLIYVTAPSETAWIVAGRKSKIPTYLLQLDPFYNHGDIINQREKRKFLRIVKDTKHIFTTDLLYKEYELDQDMKHLLNKISIVQFPKLDLTSYSLDKYNNKIPVLLYTGTLYHDIRNPNILIELKNSLGSSCDVWFCGGCDNKEDENLIIKSGIKYFGYLQEKELKEKIRKADIMINIGNLVHNQLGSKLIDYISTGKPIINITQIDPCPTLKVLETYPLKLNIESKKINNSSINIMNFCIENKNKIVSDKLIIENYKEYTPSYVANQILLELKKDK